MTPRKCEHLLSNELLHSLLWYSYTVMKLYPSLPELYFSLSLDTPSQKTVAVNCSRYSPGGRVSTSGYTRLSRLIWNCTVSCVPHTHTHTHTHTRTHIHTHTQIHRIVNIVILSHKFVLSPFASSCTVYSCIMHNNTKS